jgi:hypothetical protein
VQQQLTRVVRRGLTQEAQLILEVAAHEALGEMMLQRLLVLLAEIALVGERQQAGGVR